MDPKMNGINTPKGRGMEPYVAYTHSIPMRPKTIAKAALQAVSVRSILLPIDFGTNP